MIPLRITLLTYNLWNTQSWPGRKSACQRFFQRFQPDIFCLQELRPETRAALDGAMPGYRRVEDGRPGWARESSIYWNASLFEEVEHGLEDIAIHSDPERGLFWARLRLLDTGQTLFVSTAHYTFQEHSAELHTGQSPRMEQARQTVQALKRLVHFNEPAFFLGDLNDPILPVRILAEAGYLSCFARLEMLPPPTWPALPTAALRETDTYTNQVIDWIVSNDRARPVTAGVPQFYYDGHSPSDHWPVLAVYQLEEERPENQG